MISEQQGQSSRMKFQPNERLVTAQSPHPTINSHQSCSITSATISSSSVQGSSTVHDCRLSPSLSSSPSCRRSVLRHLTTTPPTSSVQRQRFEAPYNNGPPPAPCRSSGTRVRWPAVAPTAACRWRCAPTGGTAHRHRQCPVLPGTAGTATVEVP